MAHVPVCCREGQELNADYSALATSGYADVVAGHRRAEDSVVEEEILLAHFRLRLKQNPVHQQRMRAKRRAAAEATAQTPEATPGFHHSAA